MSTTKSVDEQLEEIAKRMERQIQRGQNCEKTNSKYRELIKLKSDEN